MGDVVGIRKEVDERADKENVAKCKLPIAVEVRRVRDQFSPPADEGSRKAWIDRASEKPVASVHSVH